MSEVFLPEAILSRAFLTLNMEMFYTLFSSLQLSKIAINFGKLVDLRSTEACDEHEK